MDDFFLVFCISHYYNTFYLYIINIFHLFSVLPTTLYYRVNIKLVLLTSTFKKWKLSFTFIQSLHYLVKVNCGTKWTIINKSINKNRIQNHGFLMCVFVVSLLWLEEWKLQTESHQGSNSDSSKEAEISAGCLERLHIQIAFLLHNTLQLNTLHTTFVLWMLRGLSPYGMRFCCVCACHTLFSVHTYLCEFIPL